jgi:hypothetical protein
MHAVNTKVISFLKDNLIYTMHSHACCQPGAVCVVSQVRYAQSHMRKVTVQLSPQPRLHRALVKALLFLNYYSSTY